MDIPLGTIFNGDVSILPGLDSLLYGDGRLRFGAISYVKESVNGSLLISSSKTSIEGNVHITGTDSNVVIDDSIIIVNNGASETSPDGGIAIRRYQTPNDINTGNVIGDTPEEIGAGTMGSTSITLRLKVDITGGDDYYKDWWIRAKNIENDDIQVRKIKSYNSVTQTITIYGTGEESGMNFTHMPGTQIYYELFPCQFVMAIWDESEKEFALVCNPNDNLIGAGTHYTNLHIHKLRADIIEASNINIGTIGSTIISITLSDLSTSYAPITQFPKTYGSYLVFIQPEIKTYRTQGIFMIGKADTTDPNPPPGYIALPGSVVRLMSVRGSRGEQLDMRWISSRPEIKYSPGPIAETNTNTTYKIKIVSLDY